MKKANLFLLLIFIFSSMAHAKFGGKFGFFASLNGSLDFVDFKKPAVSDSTYRGTGFGLEVSPGVRFGSSISASPFAMFSSISNSDDEDLSYLFVGYGGELKIRFAPINFKGGYGLYRLTEKIKDVDDDTKYNKGAGWHLAVGFEALLGPGLTIFLDAKYRNVNFVKNRAELKSTSAVLGVSSYF